MSKRIVVVALVLILAVSATSANPLFGLRMGLGNYNMTGVENESTNANSIWGGSFGFFMIQHLGGLFFIQPWIMYVSQGFTKVHLLQNPDFYSRGVIFSAVNETNEATEEASFGYIQIPVLLKYEIPLQGKLKPSVMLGPSFSFNVSSKNKISGFGEYDGEYKIRNLKKLDLRGIMGVGASFPIGKLNFAVDVIYERGFGSAFKDVSEEELANDVNEELWTKSDPETFERTTTAAPFKNSGFSFQVGMILPIGKNK